MPQSNLSSRIAALQAQALSGEAAVKAVIDGPKTALVSSFGADSAVLLHMVATLRPDLPVIFIDTEMLFPETLRYQTELAAHLGLRDVRRITPDRGELFLRDPDGLLHQADTNACCHLRKVRPLQKALEGFDTWITGRRRDQAATRAQMPVFENEGGKRLKVNPLARWSPDDIAAYRQKNTLPAHPLVARGYPSIGCGPCTFAVAPGFDARSGRWQHQEKTECGIHFPAPDLETTS